MINVQGKLKFHMLLRQDSIIIFNENRFKIKSVITGASKSIGISFY